jgi:hypothetical protein
MADQPIMYPVKVPNSLMEWYSETGAYLGTDKNEQSCVNAELNALKWTGKGATGEVSLHTLGWMADQIENGYLETDASASALKAGRAAAQRYAEAYLEGREAEGPKEPSGLLVDGVAVPLSFGLPVYHVRDTSRVVGFLTPGNARFVPVEDVKAELSRANDS